ncbi:MAG: cyclic nucleotide-binding domain-containing protein [Brumimicrobium sp.]
MDYWQHLKSTVSQIVELDDKTWEEFTSIWTIHEVKKGEALTNTGEVEKNLYFVCEGVQRVYSIGDNLKEATLVLTYPYSFAGVVDSFLLQQPAKYSFETLSKSTFLKTSFNQLDKMIAEDKNIDQFVKTALYYAFSGLLERMVDLQCKTSEEKFKTLLKRSPQVLQVVPQKYLANYLGIDPTNFSKLMHSVRF